MWRSVNCLLQGFFFVLIALLAACAGGSGEEGDTGPASRASVEGPIEGGLRGHPLWDSWFRLEDLGYTEAEYFISGIATSRIDGATAPFTTRFILRRPLDPAAFNGTVVLDWVNVTAQFENAVDTLNSQEHFLREGYAYAHVSMQAAGLCCLPALTPKTWDPQRYAALDHPGDAFAFSMLNQIAQAIRAPQGVDAMAGLPVQTLLVAGQSQSANQLFDFVTGGHLDPSAIDGLLIHSSIGRVFRDNPPVPVMHLLSDFEALPEGPPSLENLVLWEVAGSAHQDFHVGYQQVFGQGPRAAASLPQRPASAYFELLNIAGNYGEQPNPLHAACLLAGASFPMRYSVNAAFDALQRWIREGRRPPQPPRYAFDASGTLARDTFGNALGGIRLPPVEIPVARYASTFCGLGGITVPFDTLQMGAAYGSHALYFCAIKAATAHSQAEGYLLPADAEDLLQRAQAARNRFVIAGTEACADPD
jgi:hypothetical protein